MWAYFYHLHVKDRIILQGCLFTVLRQMFYLKLGVTLRFSGVCFSSEAGSQAGFYGVLLTYLNFHFFYERKTPLFSKLRVEVDLI
jgi:hypothetical protein